MANSLPTQLAKQLLTYGPKLAKPPLTLIPFNVKAKLLQQILQLILAEQEQDEELTFLNDHWVGIVISDLGLTFEVSYQQQWLIRPMNEPAVRFTANSKELLLIAAAKEDPDTLFFQRKLGIEGDTELGLAVKNLLLSIEFDSLPAPLHTAVSQLGNIIVSLQQRSELKPV